MSKSIDSRSIDFAKTASIDMMALNNKVVNMRQVVKRTKVQVINKLCKNIAALKKKKGTEEQKTQNLRKAERLIEEIDSIKRLKEDKVSKYSLANTMSFTEVCKTSLSAGPRAMARLADHSLMQKVVSDFRTQHQDWRDLAAYLLVKQTGRRFKTKKQKQSKKLSRSVENIQASETMTKAYIQERFGEDGLKKAEQRFERKRKRAPFDKKLQSNDAVEEFKSISNENEKDVGNENRVREEVDGESDDDSKASSHSSDEETDKNGSSDEVAKSEENGHKKIKISASSSFKTEPSDSKANSDGTSLLKDNMKKEVSTRSISSQNLKNNEKKALAKKQKTIASNSELSSSDEVITSEHETPEKANQVASSKKNDECVVKELDLDISGSDSLEQESSEALSDEEKAHLSADSQNNDYSSHLPDLSNKQKKKAKLRDKKVPSILTNNPQKAITDPFFARSDDEDEEDDAPNDFDQALLLEPEDDEGFEVSAKGNKSMFYNPHGEEIYRKGVRISTQGWASQRGEGRWQRQERGRGRGRGGGFSGHLRGRGTSLGGTKIKGLFSASRDRHFGGSQDFGQLREDNSQRMQPQHSTDTTMQGPSSSEKLHPSWEASKKRKAEQSGIQAFKGSKIKFDDDD